MAKHNEKRIAEITKDMAACFARIGAAEHDEMKKFQANDLSLMYTKLPAQNLPMAISKELQHAWGTDAYKDALEKEAENVIEKCRAF